MAVKLGMSDPREPVQDDLIDDNDDDDNNNSL